MKRLSLFFIVALLLFGVYLFFAVQNPQLAAESPPSFSNYAEMMEFHNQLEVTGYGSSTGGFGSFTPWGQFTFFSVEVPHQNKFRVFIYARKHEAAPYLFIEAFILENQYPPMITFAVRDYQLFYQYQIKEETQSKKSIISD